MIVINGLRAGYPIIV